MKRKILTITIILAFSIVIFATIKTQPVVEKSACVGCSDCTCLCPTGAIAIHHGKAQIDMDKCISCMVCAKTCTYQAIRTPKQ